MVCCFFLRLFVKSQMPQAAAKRGKSVDLSVKWTGHDSLEEFAGNFAGNP